MAPKTSKKTVSNEKVVKPEDKQVKTETDTSESSLVAIKQEWFNIVKEITSTTEKLSGLEKKRDELVSKLWDLMNKNPTEHIVDEEPKEDEKKSSVKSSVKKTKSTKTEIIDDSENVDSVKPATVKKAEKPKPKVAAKPVEDDSEPEEAPKAKAKVEKPKSAAKAKPVETKPEPKPAASKKISAPVKGTPKPKIDEDSEDEKARPIANESSSESDVDSLSSVSSESDASGNDD